MVDASLRCDEAFASPTASPATGLLSQQEYQELVPQFCSSYRDRALAADARVFSNMLNLEPFYLPAPDGGYSSLQREVKPHMRRIVAEWMLEVCRDQGCHPDVFLLACNIMDRFLGTIAIRKEQFQLLGAAAIFLASKLVEPSPVPAVTLVRYTADTYDREELLSMELLILSKLKWDLTAITAYDFMDHLLEGLQRTTTGEGSSPRQQEQQQPVLLQESHLESLRRHTERLVTLCATDAAFLAQRPSLVASASLASAVQQDFESEPPAADGAKLAEIFEALCRITKIEMARLKRCVDQIEDLFVDGGGDEAQQQQQPPATPPPPAPPRPSASSSSPAAEPSSSEGFHSSPGDDRLPPPPPSKRQKKDEEDVSPSSSTTPTGVFDVSAFCVA